MSKISLALYWSAACGGCDVAVLDINEKLIDLAGAADIVFWPAAVDHKYADLEQMEPGSIDICLCHGAVRNSENEHLVKMLREKSRTVVAFGSCAVSGGIPALANFYTREDILEKCYIDSPSTSNPAKTFPALECRVPGGSLDLPEFWNFVHSLDQVVEVDYFVPGCPPAAERIWEVVQAVVSGSLPEPKSTAGALEKSVCDECTRTKQNKKVDRFYRVHEIIPDPERCLLEQGLVCMGPATRAGCGARCVNAHQPCRGCYGPLPGVIDQGAKFISSLGSILDAYKSEAIAELVDKIPDPAGTFYRFGMSQALLKGANKK